MSKGNEEIMEKVILLVICITLLFISCNKYNKKQDTTISEQTENVILLNKTMFVNASSGLRVSSLADIDSEVLGILNNETEVNIIREENYFVTINDVEGKWVYINKPIEGWIFNGYLTDYIIPDIDYLTKNFDNFVIDGSTTMIPLHQSLKEKFSSKNNEVKHKKTVEAFESFLEGKTHILFSVDYSNELLDKAKEKGIKLAKKEITKEGFVFLINKNNSVKNLTIEQIKGIYGDKIKNWNEVGGDNMPIKAYQRNSDSGSQIRMIKFMGKNNLSDKAVNYISEMGYVIKVMNDYDSGKYSIAYNMYTFTEKQYPSEDVILLAVNGVYPTDETIFNETYPIVINNYIFYDSNNDIVSEFVEKLYIFLIADEGQKMISDSGYINIKKQYDRNLNIANQDLDNLEIERIDIGWRNKEKNEFYELDYKTDVLSVFYNYPDFILRNSKYITNNNAREFLTLIYNSNYDIDRGTSFADGEEISFYIWNDMSLDPDDYFNLKYNQKYYYCLYYYPDEDKYILNAANHFLNSYKEDIIRNYSVKNFNNIAVSDLEIKKEDLKKIYFRSYDFNKNTKEFDYNLLF